jgi:pantoate--beta-alanine ligase
VRSFLGLGANLGDREGALREAVAALPDVVAASPVYETDPVGTPEGSPAYLNAVVELDSALTPRQLLELARRLEGALGRVRTGPNAPRTLDVDVLLAGDEVVDERDLVVPHPRMRERRFVLAPLADLAPELVPAGQLETAEGEVRRADLRLDPGPVRVVRTAGGLAAALDAERALGRRIGLVPTLGALHEGHASLIRQSAADDDVTCVTIFVNPLQFGPGEDLSAYPRTFEADLRVAAGAGASIVFAPPPEEMDMGVTRVVVGGPGAVLEATTRPGHLEGVATVVTRLFALAGRSRAYFGEKDWQQLLVVRRLVADLSFPVEVVGCPTVREPDGLACSSRNVRLSADERAAATVLHRALTGAVAAMEAGERDAAAVGRAMAETVAGESLVELDYATIVRAADLAPLVSLEGDVRAVVAAWVGKTRLIDNVGVTVPALVRAGPVAAAAEGGA